MVYGSRMNLLFIGFVLLLGYAAAQTTTGLKCRAINEWAGQADMDKWCTNECAIDHCPEYACNCDPPTTTTTRPVTTPTEPLTTPTQPKITPTQKVIRPTAGTEQIWTNCKAINLWTGYELLDSWCAKSCPKGHCPETSCKCFNQSSTNSQTTPTQKPTISLVKTTNVATPTSLLTLKSCKAIGIWKDISVFDQWCNQNCAKGKSFCPFNTCECSDLVAVPTNPTSKPVTVSTTKATTRSPAAIKAASTRAPIPSSTQSPFNTPTQAPMASAQPQSNKRCYSNGVLAGDYWNGWCQKQCDKNDCQVEYCHC